MKWTRWSRPALAAVAAVTMGLGVAGSGPAASAAGAQAVSASLAKPVVAASCSGTPTVCDVGVAVGATGFPFQAMPDGSLSVSTSADPGAGDWGYFTGTSGGTRMAGWWGKKYLNAYYGRSGPLSSGQVVNLHWTQPESVSGQGTGGENVTTGGSVTAAGVALGTYTLSGSTTPWSVTVTANDHGDLTAVSGGYSSYGTTEYNFDVTGVSGGRATAVEYSSFDGPFSAPQTLVGGGLALDGVTFEFAGASATVGDQVQVDVSPQIDTYDLAGTDLSGTDWPIAGDLVVLLSTHATKILSFTSQSVPDIAQTIAVSGTSTSLTTPEPAWDPTSATLTIQ